jgi:hypothetical protein
MASKAVNRDDVYGLVRSLSTAETNLYRKSLGGKTGKSQPQHVRLFELLASGKAVDDAGCKEALSINGAQFSNLKQYLSAEILAVIVPAAEDSPLLSFYAGMQQLDLLAQRGNKLLARKLYKKLWPQAERVGRYDLCLLLLDYRDRIADTGLLRLSQREINETIRQGDHYRRLQDASARLNVLNQELQQLRAYSNLRVNEDEMGNVLELRARLELLQETCQEEVFLLLRYFSTLAGISYLQKDFAYALRLVELGRESLNENPEQRSLNAEAMLDLASCGFYSAFAIGNVNLADELLVQFESLTAELPVHSAPCQRWQVIRFNTELKIAHKTGNYAKVGEHLHNYKRILGYAEEHLSVPDLLSILSTVCISLFVLEDFDGAEDLILDIKNLNRTPEREDLLYFSLVFHLLILYEKKDWFRLDNMTQAAYHYLYSRRKLRPFEKEIMRFLKHLPVLRGRGTSSTAISSFLIRLEEFRNDPVQRLYFLYFNYYDWLQSKLAGISYRDYKSRALAMREENTLVSEPAKS